MNFNHKELLCAVGSAFNGRLHAWLQLTWRVSVSCLFLLTTTLPVTFAGLNKSEPNPRLPAFAGGTRPPLSTKSRLQQVTGKVSDEKGEALPGVSIILKGGQLGTTTGADGVFQINVPDNTTAILVFSYVGYIAQEVTVGNRSSIDVSLKEDSKSLDEVVVTALGMQREKRSLGYAIGEVKSNEINRVPQQNALGGLNGKVTGLKISNSSNELNAETHVYIRGITSLAGNTDPLIIVDGVPAGNPDVMRDISADNIASISVLKGPSAAALYGSRAGNGVLIVTTKTGAGAGQKGLGVTFNTNVTATVPYKYVELQHRFTTGKRGIFDEGAYQHNYGPEEGTEVVQWNTNGVAKPLKFYPNNRQNYFETGTTYINDLSVGGSYDKGSFRLALSNLKGKGNTPGMELNRFGVNLASNYKIRQDLTVSTNINITNSNSDNYPVQESEDYPYMDLYDLPIHADLMSMKDYWLVKDEQQRNVNASFNNPWFSSLERVKRFDRNRMIGNIKLDWQILPNLNLMGRISQNRDANINETLNPWSLNGGIRKAKGGYLQKQSTLTEINSDVLLTYKETFGDFYVAPSAGANIMRQKNRIMSTGGDNLVLPGLFTAANIDRAGLVYSAALYNKAIYSAYGMVTTGYKDMVYLDLTARNDWSSTLPINNRSYFYPSASLSLMFSEMLKLPPWMNLGKLRAGWAQVGKDTDPYQIQNTLSRGTWGAVTYYSNPNAMNNTALKPEIATSIEVGADLGFFKNRLSFDATFYTVKNKNQILNVDLPALSGYTGTTINAGIVENRGLEIGMNIVPVKQNNLLWNVHLNFTRDRSKLTELTTGVDRVQFWAENGGYAVTKVGEYIGDIYGYDALRVKDGGYKDWALLSANGKLQKAAELTKIGNYIQDFFVGGQTSVTYKKLTLAASFDWRQGGDFYSVTMMRLARGGKMEDYKNGSSSSTYSGILGSNSFGGDVDQLAKEIKSNPGLYRDGNVWIGGRNKELGGFTYNGTDQGAFFPGVISDGKGGYKENFGATGTQYINTWEVNEPGGGYWDTAMGSKWIYDASFVKLREISLSYDLPSQLAQKIRSKGISVSAFARNIMLWTAAGINIDPEVAYMRRQSLQQSQGIERWGGSGPWLVSGGVSLKVEF